MITTLTLTCPNVELIVFYFRKEGRSLGEVTKYLVNPLKQQESVDSAKTCLTYTE